MFGRPLADLTAAAAQDGDVQRVDAHLHELLGVTGRTLRRQAAGTPRSRTGSVSRIEPLQSPVAAALDRGRHAGERHERAELAATAARELERGHVVLDAVVVAGERRGSEQVHGAVRADEPAARECRSGSEKKSADGAEEGRLAPAEESAHSSHL